MNQIIKDIGKVVLLTLTLLALSSTRVGNADNSKNAYKDWNSVKDWNPQLITMMQNDMCDEYGWKDKALIHELSKHESINLKVPYLIDTNNKPSIGLYHFQEGTFERYCVNNFGLKDDINNPVVQTICVIKMGQRNLIHTNWVLSYKKIMRNR